MSVYLVTYDLNSPGQKHTEVLEKIKNYGSWARLSESSYAISTHETVGQVYGKFEPLIDSNDNLYVISLHRPYTGFGKKDVNEWLQNNLTSC